MNLCSDPYADPYSEFRHEKRYIEQFHIELTQFELEVLKFNIDMRVSVRILL